MTLGLKALELASASVGVREDPGTPNWSKYIRLYLAAVGIFSPAPWCMGFVVFKIVQAAKALGVSTDWPKTGSCSAVYRWAKKAGRILPQPQTGCVFLVKGGVPGLYIHTGFVKSVNADGTFRTIEGNTNDSGSPEGVGVFARARRIKTCIFVRV